MFAQQFSYVATPMRNISLSSWSTVVKQGDPQDRKRAKGRTSHGRQFSGKYTLRQPEDQVHVRRICCVLYRNTTQHEQARGFSGLSGNGSKKDLVMLRAEKTPHYAQHRMTSSSSQHHARVEASEKNCGMGAFVAPVEEIRALNSAL